MNPNDAASVAEGLAKALENPQETNSDRLSSLGDALAALAARMNPNDAASVARTAVLAKALENPQETDSDRLSSLGDALAALAARMNPNDAASVADGLAKALENPQETNSDRLSSLGDALAALAARMNPNDAASVAARGAWFWPRRWKTRRKRILDRLSSLGDALAALAARMNPNDAASVAAMVLAKALENPQETNLRPPVELERRARGPRRAHEPQRRRQRGRWSGQGAGEPAGNESRPPFELGLSARGPRRAHEPRRRRQRGRELVLAKALENPQETNSDRLSSLGDALAALAARMNPNDAASVADGLAKALENPQETDSDRLSSLGDALAALAARMNPNDAASVARAEPGFGQGAGKPAGNGFRPPVELGLRARGPRRAHEPQRRRQRGRARSLGSGQGAGKPAGNGSPTPLAAIESRRSSRPSPREHEPQDGRQLGRTREPRFWPRRWKTRRKRIPTPVELGLRARGPRRAHEPQRRRQRGRRALAKALENPQETDSYRLSSLGEALAALAARMNPNDAASVAARGASVLAKALENPQETDSDRLSSLGEALAALAAQIPSARQTQLVALSNLFLGNVSGPPKNGKGREDEAQDRTRIARICGLLNAEELAEVLKWPFCVGEAQKLVFAELEKKIKEKIGRTFDGDVWKFVEQVDSLGINGLDRKFLDQPAKRPKAEDALKELEAIRANVEKNPPSPTRPLSPSR